MHQATFCFDADDFDDDDIDAPAQQHSETSCDAARKITPHIGELHYRLLAAFAVAGIDGMTDEQGIDVTGLSPSTYRPRRIELVNAGILRDSGSTRKTRSGRNAVIWILAEKKK